MKRFLSILLALALALTLGSLGRFSIRKRAGS